MTPRTTRPPCVWSSKQSFGRPPGANTPTKRVVWDATRHGSVKSTHERATELHKHRTSAVSELDRSCDPSAIGGFVVPIRVNSVELVHGRRPGSHISKEVAEVRPPLAHADSSATVPLIRLMGWVATPGAHVSPCIALAGKASGKVRVSHEAPQMRIGQRPAAIRSRVRASLFLPVCSYRASAR
jgi:hypothetical protein